MKERPILFSGPMVRAILEGRKTQTRRVVKPQGAILTDEMARAFGVRPPPTPNAPVIPCPFGAPGDRLWVKETWQAWRYCSIEYDEWDVCDCAPSEIRERFGNPKLEYAATSDSVGPWRPSIHMPRWASRITLEIEAVRVERLKHIGEADCRAEGCKGGNGSIPGYAFSATPREHYRHVWQSINGPGSWDANPWVWVIQFRRVNP